MRRCTFAGGWLEGRRPVRGSRVLLCHRGTVPWGGGPSFFLKKQPSMGWRDGCSDHERHERAGGCCSSPSWSTWPWPLACSLPFCGNRKEAEREGGLFDSMKGTGRDIDGISAGAVSAIWPTLLPWTDREVLSHWKSQAHRRPSNLKRRRRRAATAQGCHLPPGHRHRLR